MTKISEIPKLTAVLIINLYQKTLSFDHGFMGKVFLNTRYCKFSPSCSEYTKKSIERYGLIRGGVLGFKRILKCHPFSSKHGYDPVP